jgi:bud site selection protein 31
MPKIQKKNKKIPEGFTEIEEKLKEFEMEIRDAEQQPHYGKRKIESVWKLLKLTHQRTRYIYDLYYKEKSISKNLMDFLIKNKYVDRFLIAKWKKNGYEKLCCVLCIQNSKSNFGNTCICRVPKSKLDDNKLVQCTNCGCRGCASCD